MEDKSEKVCSFIGHRKIEETDCLKSKLLNLIEDLIINRNVTVFLFGSKSEFNTLCHKTVTQLKDKYPHIIRGMYTCKSEVCTSDTQRQRWEDTYSSIYGQKVNLLGYEKEFEFKGKYVSGRASYVERNQAMIDGSDYCVFYYKPSYVPASKNKSGTKIAYEYALRKRKTVFNIFATKK